RKVGYAQDVDETLRNVQNDGGTALFSITKYSPPAQNGRETLKKPTSTAPAKERSKFARGPTTFKKTAAARFVRGVMATGLPTASVECDTLTGTIRVFAGQPGSTPKKNELDDWMERHANSAEGH